MLLPTDARVDDFGGGTVTSPVGQLPPALYEVGPGKPFATIQAGVDAAAAQAAGSPRRGLPGTPRRARLNPRGAYYENLIIDAPVKLQGVGPGGSRDGTRSPDRSSTAARSAVTPRSPTPGTTGRRADVGRQPDHLRRRRGRPARPHDAFGASFPATIDGFDLRGGDQQGFPNNPRDRRR